MHTLVILLGLHRKTAKRSQMSPLELERRKRAFWSFYAIDGYMSVMLGQPRLLRDQDIDQEYPVNIDDAVLDTTVDLDHVPHHGTLEAFVFHAKLSRLFAQSNDELYPLRKLTKEEIVEKGHNMVAALDQLQSELPNFLKPRSSAVCGTQTWQRQNSVLSLALAHARIIATRRTLLISTGPTGWLDNVAADRHQSCMRVCLDAVCSILDQVHQMMQHGRLLWGFWLTQYKAICAISTFLVFKIRTRHGRISSPLSLDVAAYTTKAEQVQDYLAKIAPPGSQAKRHHSLLLRLKQRASQDSTGRERQNATTTEQDSSDSHQGVLQQPMAQRTQSLHSYDGLQQILPGPNMLSDDGMTPLVADSPFAGALTWQYLDQWGPMQPDIDPCRGRFSEIEGLRALE